MFSLVCKGKDVLLKSFKPPKEMSLGSIRRFCEGNCGNSKVNIQDRESQSIRGVCRRSRPNCEKLILLAYGKKALFATSIRRYGGEMQARKKHKGKPTSLPTDVLHSVGKLFNEQFAKEKEKAEFLVYSQMFMDELLLCISLVDPKSLRAGTIYLSVDLPKGVVEKPDQVTQKLQKMVDVAASWFAQSFSEGKLQGLPAVLEAMTDMPNTWQDFIWEKETLYVKLNRDNPVLEKQANKFLQNAGHSEEEFQDDLDEDTEAELEKMVDEIMEENLDDDEAVTDIELGTAGVKRKKPPLQ